MAADLILHAVDPFPGAERVIPVMAYTELLEPVEERHLVDNDRPDWEDNVNYIREHWDETWPYRIEETEDGPEFVEIVEGNDRGRHDLFEWIIDRDAYDRIDIGPFSTMKAGLDGDNRWLPGPVVSLSRYLHIGAPVLLTPAVASEIMVRLNVADRSYYKDHKRGVGYYKAGRSKHLFVSTRRAKRQWVKKWLNEHMGSLVWLSTE